MPTPKTSPVSFRLPFALVAQIDARAEKDGRNRNALVTETLQREFGGPVIDADQAQIRDTRAPVIQKRRGKRNTPKPTVEALKESGVLKPASEVRAGDLVSLPTTGFNPQPKRKWLSKR